MSTATVTFEDAGDDVKISIDFGEGGPQETCNAHQMASWALALLNTQVDVKERRTE